jgi:hypothetical protein
MRDNNDPERVGLAIREIMQSHRCSITQAADLLFNHLNKNGAWLPKTGTGGNPAVASGLLSSAALDGRGPSEGLSR